MSEEKQVSNADIRKKLFRMADEIREKQIDITTKKSLVIQAENELVTLQYKFEQELFDLFPNEN
ncbi:MAG: hypothetical protein K2Y32_00370 [Candidatus Obscuribacterales bacterium]|nr:hypothetical protein [Candidatus Obscuribacterales bacterium]